MENLLELTGQESGIVIYDGKEAVVCNWSDISGYPRLMPMGLPGVIGLGEEIPETTGNHEDLTYLLEGVEIIYSNDEDKPVHGTVYRITDEITVITPDGWC